MTRRVLEFLVLTATYVAAGKLGLSFAPVTDSTTAVWPPAGLALGALLLLGPRVWPAIATGAFIVNLFTLRLVEPSLLMAAGNTIEALVGWWLVTRFAGGAAAFDRAGTVFRFAVIATVAPLIAASIGTAAQAAFNLAQDAEYRLVWLTWWVGDTVGVITIAPLVVMWARPSRKRWTVTRGAEFAAVLAAVVVVSWGVFGNSRFGSQRYPLPFLAVPVLLWPAFRLGGRETVVATVVMSAVAIVGTVNGYGPFANRPPELALLALDLFVGVWTVAMLAVSAEVEARESTDADLRTLNEHLEERVRRRTEELKRMHDRLADAQRVASVGSWEWDVQANTIWWSDELFRIFRVAPVQHRTYESYLALLDPAERSHVERSVTRALASRGPFSFEHGLRWPDGTARTIQADGHVLTDARGDVARLVGTARDVTDLRRAEIARLEKIREQAARIEAEDANRAKDEFLATLSHELRTPLNAALGWTHMLRNVVDDPAGRARAVDAVLRNLKAQARLVSDMMDLSLITLRTLRLDQAPVNMRDVVRSAIDSVRDPMTSRAIRVDARLPDGPVYVIGDDGRLEQVVWNLLSNSAKFSQEGGLVVVTLECRDDEVRLVVDDEGCGIDPAFMPHVFERFRQADSSATRQHGGLGLGLAIARHLVEAHGGRIEASNRAGGGAQFVVTLPSAPVDAGV